MKTAEATVKVSDIEITMERMRTENQQLKQQNLKMQENLKEREVKITSQSNKINEIEQYTRKKQRSNLWSPRQIPERISNRNSTGSDKISK